MKPAASLGRFVLACGFSAVVAQEPPRRSTIDGVFSTAQAQRGKQLYQARCAVCHGQDLTGDIEAPPLNGPRFNFDWIDKDVAERVQRTRDTMPPEQPGSLDQGVAVDILAFILEFNGYPSGKQDLAIDRGELADILIERLP